MLFVLVYKTKVVILILRKRDKETLIPLSDHPRKFSSKIFVLVPSNIRSVGILSLFCAKEARDRGYSKLFYPRDDGAVELLTQPWAEPRNVLKKTT